MIRSLFVVLPLALSLAENVPEVKPDPMAGLKVNDTSSTWSNFVYCKCGLTCASQIASKYSLIVSNSLHFNTFANGFHCLFFWVKKHFVDCFFCWVGFLKFCTFGTFHWHQASVCLGKADGILVRLQLGTELCLRPLPRWKCHRYNSSHSCIARKPGASTCWKANSFNRIAETWFQILKSRSFVDVFCLFVLRFHRTRPGDSCHDFSSKRSQILRRKLGQEVEELGASRSRPFRGSCLGGCSCTWKQLALLHLGRLLLHAFIILLQPIVTRSPNILRLFQVHLNLWTFQVVSRRHCISQNRAREEELVHVIMCVREPARKFLQEPCCSKSVPSFFCLRGKALC